MVQFQEATPTSHGQESLDKVFVNQSKALLKAGTLEFDYYNVCKCISLPKCIMTNHCSNLHKNAKSSMCASHFFPDNCDLCMCKGVEKKKKKKIYIKSQKCLVLIIFKSSI